MREVEEVQGELVPDGEARPLPVPRDPGQLERRAEVAATALAAAGGLVAGAATVAAVRAATGNGRRPARRGKRSERPANILASRSFLVDIHLLGNGK